MAFRTLLRVYLEGKGHHVDEAADARAALEQARIAVPDVILLDPAMPRRDGWQALQGLCEDPRLARVPVVVLTRRADESTEWRAKELGASRYVTKPVSLDDLLGMVDQLLA